jgi:hypothetical protein
MNACCTIPVITLLLQGDGPIHLQQPIRYNRLTNVDGYQFFCRRVSGKAVGIVARAGARGTCVALLDPSAGQITETTLGDVEAAARPKGLQIQVLNVQTSRDINAAFTTFMRERPDAFFVGPGPFFTSRRVQLALLAALHRVPAIYIRRKTAQPLLPGLRLDAVGWTLDLRPNQFGAAVGCFNDLNFPPPVASIWEEEMCASAILPAGIQHFLRA